MTTWEPGRQAAQNLKLLWQGLLDVFYPPHCLVCEAPDVPPLCETCYATFAPIPDPACAVCGRPCDVPPCRLCGWAEQNGGWGFDQARACGIYEGPLREAVHRLKFQGAELLGDPLGHFCAGRALGDGLLTDCLGSGETVGAVVPVPLHPSRQRQRGYNQSALVAAPLAETLGVPLVPDALARPRKARAQVGLTADARRGNVTGQSFYVRDGSLVTGKTVVLVDDVFTTGTTLSAAASALKTAGAKRVIALALSAGG